MASELPNQESPLPQDIMPNSPPRLLSLTMEPYEAVPLNQRLPDEEAEKLDKGKNLVEDDNEETESDEVQDAQNLVLPTAVKLPPPIYTQKRGRPPTFVQERIVILALPAKEVQSQFRKTRARRPRSSTKNQQLSLPISTETTLHTITIEAGGNVFSKIMEFVNHCQRDAVVISGNGTISSATITGVASGITTTYEGSFYITTLRGSFLFDKSSSHLLRGTDDQLKLKVMLSGLDNQLYEGIVAGRMVAASRVQVTILLCFIASDDDEDLSEPCSALTLLGNAVQ